MISILLVEDSILDADLTLEHLTRAGIEFQVRRVETRSAFLSAIHEAPPDLILCDYALPDFDGVSALSLAQEHCADTPFLFVSGAIGEEQAIDSLKRGATDYVFKHRLDRLAPAVRRALSESRERCERKKAENALRKSEERLRLALNAAGLGAWELDLSAGSMECSPTCLLNLGLTASDLVTYQTLRQLVHPEDRPSFDCTLEAAAARLDSFQLEHRIVRPDSSVRWMITSGRGIRDNGSPARIIGVNMDITERKQFEVDLAKQARELSSLNTDLQQFAYAASHDLQEPLRMVSCFTQLLAKRYRTGFDEQAQEFFDYIETATRRMSDLLSDLLAYTHVPTLQRTFGPVEMNDVLDQVLRLCSISMEETGASITAEPLPCIRGDASQLGQVMQNLIANALKYRGSRPPSIHIQAEQKGESWLFSVRDNGIGFEQKYAVQIFGLFKRLHKDRYPGTGLGLAICKRIIERHGGQIWAESSPDSGSTFYFSIPAVPCEIGVAEQTTPIAS